MSVIEQYFEDSAELSSYIFHRLGFHASLVTGIVTHALEEAVMEVNKGKGLDVTLIRWLFQPPEDVQFVLKGRQILGSDYRRFGPIEFVPPIGFRGVAASNWLGKLKREACFQHVIDGIDYVRRFLDGSGGFIAQLGSSTSNPKVLSVIDDLKTYGGQRLFNSFDSLTHKVDPERIRENWGEEDFNSLEGVADEYAREVMRVRSYFMAGGFCDDDLVSGLPECAVERGKLNAWVLRRVQFGWR